MGGHKEDEFERTDGGVVAVKPKPNKGLTSKAIDWLEWAFVKMMHDPKQPLHYLAGNFAPVDETPPLVDLPVQGNLPVSSAIVFDCLFYYNCVIAYFCEFVGVFLLLFYGCY